MQSLALSDKFSFAPMDASVAPQPPVIINGTPPTPPSSGHNTGSGNDSGSSGLGGTGSGSGGQNASNNGGKGYETAGVTAAANNFADRHAANQDGTAKSDQWYHKIHDSLAQLFDYANAHPSEMVDLGNHHSITMQQVLANLANIAFVLTQTPGLTGSTGAQCNTVAGLPYIGINPEHWNMVNAANFGDKGMQYEMFHELGHAMNYFSDPERFYNQNDANSAGWSLESKLGYQQMPGITYDY